MSPDLYLDAKPLPQTDTTVHCNFFLCNNLLTSFAQFDTSWSKSLNFSNLTPSKHQNVSFLLRKPQLPPTQTALF